MERIREMFKTPPVWRTRHQSFSGSPSEKPGGRTRHDSGPGSYQYVKKPHKKPPKFSRRPPQDSGYQSQTPSRPRPQGFPHVKEKRGRTPKTPRTPRRPPVEVYKPPRQLVTNVREWYTP